MKAKQDLIDRAKAITSKGTRGSDGRLVLTPIQRVELGRIADYVRRNQNLISRDEFNSIIGLTNNSYYSSINTFKDSAAKHGVEDYETFYKLAAIVPIVSDEQAPEYKANKPKKYISINVKLPKELHTKIKSKAFLKGKLLKDYISELLEQSVDGEQNG